MKTMDDPAPSASPALLLSTRTTRHVSILFTAGVWLILLLVFLLLYAVSKRTIMEEIRQQVMGIAIAVAQSIDARDIQSIRTADDMETPEFLAIQQYITGISRKNPAIRFIYTMRRVQAPGAQPHEYEFVVDEETWDRNQNGIITECEMAEPTGAPYDASELPEMIAAWERPAADHSITPDPPYPDMISGYAPIRDHEGNTVAIVGVDMTADTVREKLLAIRIALLIGFLLIGLLVSWSLYLLNRTRHALEENRALAQELEQRNNMLRAANLELVRLNQVYEDELSLAQTVQRGFLPQQLPTHRSLRFDQCFITCAMLGGDLYDVFAIDEQHIGLYVADVAGHGASAALISTLLKMAMESIKNSPGAHDETRHKLLTDPARTLGAANDLVIKEMPGDKFVTMMYAVFDLTSSRCLIGSAGHPPPLMFRARTGTPEICSLQNGPAVGLIPDASYRNTAVPFEQGDKMVFYTDGLTEAMDDHHEEFGEKRLLTLVAQLGNEKATNWAERITQAVDQHRGPCAINDDFTLLVTDLTPAPPETSQPDPPPDAT